MSLSNAAYWVIKKKLDSNLEVFLGEGVHQVKSEQDFVVIVTNLSAPVKLPTSDHSHILKIM